MAEWSGGANKFNRSHSDHAAEQLLKRYGIRINPDRILQMIREGKGRQHRAAVSSRLIWDVEFPANAKHSALTVRVVVDSMVTRIISALPPEFPADKKRRAEKHRKQEFFRHLDEDEDAVTEFKQ